MRLGLLIGGALLLAGCQKEPTTAPAEVADASPSPIASPTDDPTKVADAQKALRSEPKIIDLVYDPEAAVQWTIGVKTDGTSRFGYALYVCTLLGEHDLVRDETEVRIVDYGKYIQLQGDAQTASLGHARCSSGQNMGV